MADNRVSIPPWFDRAAALSWRFLVVVAALGALLFVLVQLWILVLAVVLALFVSTVLGPPAVWLHGRGWPPLVAAWTVYLAGLAVFVGVGLLIVPSVLGQLEDLTAVFGDLAAAAERWLEVGVFGMTGPEVQQHVERVIEGIGDNAGQLVGGLLGGALIVFETVVAVVLAFVLTFFFVKDSHRFTAAAEDLAGDRGSEIKEVGRRIWEAVGGYVRGSAVVGLIDATLIGAGLIILGVPLALPLIVLTFFGAFFPIIGAWVAGIAAAGVAAITLGWVQGLIVAGLAFAVQQVESNLLEPLVLGRAVALHPVVILLVLTAGGILFGILGALIAVPFSAAVANVLEYYRTVGSGARSAAAG